MSEYYNPQRKGNLYDPQSTTPFRLSRTKILDFIKCPLCFYMDRRLGIGQPPGYPFALNSAVDALLKKEFDIHRAKGTAHPLMKTYGLKTVPFQHPDIDKWRDSLRRGIMYQIPNENIVVTGGVDDVWVSPDGKLIIVDYKSTAKDKEVGIDEDWQIDYKRQMEIYQWLFMKNGFDVSKTGYFVYCNGCLDRKAFDGKLEFNIKLIPYKGNYSWVEKTIHAAIDCLKSDKLPECGDDCDFCKYRNTVGNLLI